MQKQSLTQKNDQEIEQSIKQNEVRLYILTRLFMSEIDGKMIPTNIPAFGTMHKQWGKKYVVTSTKECTTEKGIEIYGVEKKTMDKIFMKYRNEATKVA